MSDTQDERTVQLLEQAVGLLGMIVARPPLNSEASQQDRILVLHVAGLQSKQISQILSVSLKTVQNRIGEAKRG